MKVNGIEQDFLWQVRTASPEDCKVIVAALQALDGREDEEGELTPLGMLAGAIIEELNANGILKIKYEAGKEACGDV